MVFTILGYLLLGIGYLLLAIVVLLAAVILIPYEYQVSGENSEQPQLQGRISWLFGGIRISFHHDFHSKATITPILFGFRIQRQNKNIPPKDIGMNNSHSLLNNRSKNSDDSKGKKDNQHESSSKSSKQKKKGMDFRRFLKKDILYNVFAVIQKLFRHFRPHQLAVEARIGFDDPMLTGILCALTSQFSDVINQYDIHLQPVFDEETIQGRFSIDGRIWLAYLLVVLLCFMITKSIRNIILTQLKMKLKGGIYNVR